MTERITNSESFYEAVLKQAVIQDCLRELEALPSEQELEKSLVYSPRHISRMKKLFANEARREATLRFTSYAKKVASVAAIVIMVIFGMLMLNPNVRAVIVETIVEWFETFTRFQSQKTDTAAFNMTWRPSYVPEGFFEKDVFESVGMASIMYTNEEETISLILMPADASLSVDNENMVYTEITVDEVHFYLFESEDDTGDNILVWNSEGVRFSLVSTITIDNLLLMAQSLSPS